MLVKLQELFNKLKRFFRKINIYIEAWMSIHYFFSNNELIRAIYIYFKVIYIYILNIMFVQLINLTCLGSLYRYHNMLHWIGMKKIFFILFLLFMWMVVMRFLKKYLLKKVLETNVTNIEILYIVFSSNFIFMLFITYLNYSLYKTYLW